MKKEILEEEYLVKKKSVPIISKDYNISEGKVNYWISKYKISKRSISEAIYLKKNPKGDPFKPKKLNSKQDYFLFGLGMGLFWGEGTKMNEFAVRLGNTDPQLIKYFIKFLVDIYRIDKEKLHFGLQLFSDIKITKAISFWCEALGVKSDKFYKPVVSKSVSQGTYKKKAKYGVLTVYFNNKKMREVIGFELEKIKKMY